MTNILVYHDTPSSPAEAFNTGGSNFNIGSDHIAAVEALTKPKARVLAVQSVAWNARKIYMAVSAALRAGGADGDGGRCMTLVVSPRLGSIRDEIAAAATFGLRALSIDSSNPNEWLSVIQAIYHRRLDLLLITPQRLSSPAFAEILPDVLSSVGLIVINDAHRLSRLDGDYQPDYELVHRLVNQAPNATVLATTTGASLTVTRDLQRQLGPDLQVFRGTLVNDSPTYSVVPGLTKDECYAWVAQALARLPGSGIIYAPSPRETKKLADFLLLSGYEVAAYSGRTAAAARVEIEQRFRDQQLKAIVANSALGPDPDSPETGFCIYLGVPPALAVYHRQVNRAGSWAEGAHAVLRPGTAADSAFAWPTSKPPDYQEAEQVLAALQPGPLTFAELSAKTAMRSASLQSNLKTLEADGLIACDKNLWALTGQSPVQDDANGQLVSAPKIAEDELMQQFKGGRNCLRAILQWALGDSNQQYCGKCSVCTGTLPYPGREPSAEAVLRAIDFNFS